MSGSSKAPPWFPFYPSDWASGTDNFHGPERLLYLEMLLIQYIHGVAPDSLSLLCIKARLDPAQFTEAQFDAVAAKFSTVKSGLKNERMGKERINAIEKHKRRVEAGRKGGIKSNETDETGSNAASNAPSNATSNAPRKGVSNSQLTTHSTQSTTHKPNKGASDLVGLWNDLASTHGLSRVRRLTDARLTKCAVSIRKGILDQWQDIESEVGKSGHLRGDNSRGWAITFDWIIQPTNLQKVVEGNYRDRKGSTATPPPWRVKEVSA